MYAVVAPGFNSVYINWKDVTRAKALYPYIKWHKCKTEEEAREFIKRNSTHHVVKQLYNYGETLQDLYINAKYRIGPDCIYYVFNTKRVGRIRLDAKGVIVEYKGDEIRVKMPDIYLSDESIAGHMSAIYNMLMILGEYVDVNIEIPNYSVFYALTSYSRGSVRAISTTRNLISNRLCKVAFTMKLRNYADEREGYVDE